LRQKAIVERRVAPPGAFGVDQHRPLRADQDVLRADVAVHQRDGVRLRRLHQRLDPRREVRVARRGREQVGLEADVEEDRVGRETRRRAPGARPNARWIRASIAPTRAAVAASARPSRSACFHSS
jgi:hypothetical protein